MFWVGFANFLIGLIVGFVLACYGEQLKRKQDDEKREDAH